MDKIKGGYYIKARKIQDSDIAFAPPHVREIWDWLLKEVNHSDAEKLVIKRGQTVRSYSDIREGLKWMVGYRKEMYTKWQCEMAMKWLKKHDMITTMKTTRGMLITICNYDYYQTPENYESHTKTDTKATTKPQTTDTINNNNKNNKNKEQYKEWALASSNDLYKRFVNHIMGDNPAGVPFEKVIGLDGLVSEEVFVKLMEVAKKHDTKILDKVSGIEQKMQEGKKYKSLSLTLNNWLKNNFDKRK